jgi:RNase P/RNase MRP subunit POP5
MSKVAMPRPRYIAFELAGARVSRRALGNAIRSQARAEGWSDADAPQLTRFEWPYGIVRVEHTHASRARALLARIHAAGDGPTVSPLKVETVGTSGTLNALTGRLGALTERDAPAPSGAAALAPSRRR